MPRQNVSISNFILQFINFSPDVNKIKFIGPPLHTNWFQEFFSNNSLFWRYSLELSNLRFVWPYISLKNPRNFKKAHGKFSEPFYIENTKFHFNIMTEISTFFGPDFLSHWIPLNFCLKYLCNWQLMYARAKILA